MFMYVEEPRFGTPKKKYGFNVLRPHNTIWHHNYTVQYCNMQSQTYPLWAYQ